MEFRDPVHGTIEVHPKMEAIIDSRAFQRLRAIKQLGFGEFSYPGATHNRFLHSMGVSYLAGQIFDSIFRGYAFKNNHDKWRLRECVVLAALLHDIGHGPLSHTTEEVMPQLSELKIPLYQNRADRKANHEDYTIKIVTDSELSKIIHEQFPDIQAFHIACLIDKSLDCIDGFFTIDSVNIRPILSQIVSSELDADRMDYLLRDSYFTGASYGQIDVHWLISNLSYHQVKDQLHLALNRRALYTFDDFLISRHHMYLQVYFHHKCIIYDEMLHRFLTSKDCTFSLPANIDDYLNVTDATLYEHLRQAKNPWAQLISQRRPHRVLWEMHTLSDTDRPQKIIDALKKENIDSIYSSSKARLSKYHATSPEEHNIHKIFVIDHYDKKVAPIPIEETTKIFQMYEGTRRVERIYVARDEYKKAEQVLRLQQI